MIPKGSSNSVRRRLATLSKDELRMTRDEGWHRFAKTFLNRQNRKNSFIRHSSIDIRHAGVSFPIRLAALLEAGKLFRTAAALISN
jgi:hypothetical protein